mgnify:FL=1
MAGANRVHLLWCSRKTAPKDWWVGEHRHQYQQIILVNDGLLNIVVGDVRTRLSRGGCAFIDSFVRHKMYALKTCELIEAKFFVNDEALAAALSTIPAVCESPPESVKKCLMRLIREAAERRPFFEQAVSGILQVMLCDLFRAHDASPQVDAPGDIDGDFDVDLQRRAKGGDSPLVLAAIEYIEERFADDLSLDGLAEALGYHPSYICERFSEAVGRPPMRYLTEYRIRVAKELLAGSSLSIGEIAWKVGFKTTSYFCRVFRGMVGQSPNQFRKASQSKESVEFFFVANSVASDYGINPDTALGRAEWLYG